MSDELLLFLVAVILRLLVSFHPHSGERLPPMHGDYEAQRHWQEITVNLPLNEWYSNSSLNDLQYWGLDYPPLTAYHSFVIGKVAQYLEPTSINLTTSRGYETYDHKIFMRYSVIWSDILFFFTAVYRLCLLGREKSYATAVFLLLYPGLLLIDHGHFQYNCVSLGLFLHAIASILHGSNVMGAMFFSLALNYKQMELYHALPFFFFFLGRCWLNRSIKDLFKISMATVFTFTLCWAPLIGSVADAQQILHRIFPLARGLYEDKVANVWCSLSPILKLKTWPSTSAAMLTAATTLLTSLPSCILLFRKPTPVQLLFSLFNVSMSFFLFSFHVHEKSILLVTTPSILLYTKFPVEVSWLLYIALFSMFPLIHKERLIVAYIASILILGVISHIVYQNRDVKSSWDRRIPKFFRKTVYHPFRKGFISASILASFVLTLFKCICKAPDRYPDIFDLFITSLSCFHFVFIFILMTGMQFIAITIEDNISAINVDKLKSQ